MVDIGTSLLWIFAIVIIIAIILLIIWAIYSNEVSKNNNGGGGGNNLPPCSQNVNISSLVQIPDTGYNCIQQGKTTSLYYIGTLTNGKYDFVVAPYSSTPQVVCSGYCSTINNGTCTGPDYNGKSAQTNYDNCLTQLIDPSCSGTKPIAAKGTTLYYPFSPTCHICDNCT